MVTRKQAEDDAFWKKLEKDMGKQISAVACAGKNKDVHYPREPRDIQVIDCPVYYNGDSGPRNKGLRALQTACSQAVEDGTVVLIHCNSSFHRGPILAVACMISGGQYTKHDAFGFISERRKIYPGHIVPDKHWPDWARSDDHTPKLRNAHAWLQTLWTNMQQQA